MTHWYIGGELYIFHSSIISDLSTLSLKLASEELSAQILRRLGGSVEEMLGRNRETTAHTIALW
jgi:hypothetical protein